MRVLTIGGASQDIYLMHETSDTMSITHKDLKVDYMLLRAGCKVEVDDIEYFVGGGATNAAVSFKTLGIDASCFCNIGNDEIGTFVINSLQTSGIDTSVISRSDALATGTSFIVKASTKERTIFAFRGANGNMEQDNIPHKIIAESDLIYITSLSGEAAALLPEIVAYAHKNKVPVAINPGMSQLSGGANILQQALPFLDIFILNYEEAKAFMLSLAEDNESFKKAFTFLKEPRSCPIDITEIMHATLDEEPYLIDNPISCENLTFSIRQFFKQMLALGPRIVVVTNGSNGVYAASNNTIFYHPSAKTKLVDTVGAGDAFGSCFVASLLHHDDITTALQNGILNAASVLSKLGAKNGLLTWNELKEKEERKIKHALEDFLYNIDNDAVGIL